MPRRKYDYGFLHKVLMDYIDLGNFSAACRENNIKTSVAKNWFEKYADLKEKYDDYVSRKKLAKSELAQNMVLDFLRGNRISEISQKYQSNVSIVSNIINAYRKRNGDLKDSLCWNCNRASKFVRHPCPWAKSFKPVEGWNAEKDADSYKVIECPLFMPFEREEI